MMETIRIRKAGYPMRHHFDYFFNRYSMLLATTKYYSVVTQSRRNPDTKEAARLICEKFLGPNADWQLGRTKIFLKNTHDSFLETKRDELINLNVVKLQNWFRMHTSKKKFKYTRSKAVKIQSWYRMKKQRQKFVIIRDGFCRLQATFKSRELVKLYARKREFIIALQSMCRSKIARDKVKTEKEASKVVTIEVKHVNADLRTELLLELERNKEQFWLQKNLEESKLRKELGNAREAQKEAQRMYNNRLKSFKRKMMENPERVLSQSRNRAAKNKGPLELADFEQLDDFSDTRSTNNVIAPPRAFQDLENLDDSGSTFGRIQPMGSSGSEGVTEGRKGVNDRTDYQFSKFVDVYCKVCEPNGKSNLTCYIF